MFKIFEKVSELKAYYPGVLICHFHFCFFKKVLIGVQISSPLPIVSPLIDVWVFWRAFGHNYQLFHKLYK